MTRATKLKIICGVVALGLPGPSAVMAIGPTVEIVSQGTTITAPGYPGVGRVLPARLHGSVSVSAGYDDNPNAGGGLGGAQAGGQGTATTNVNVNLSYSGKIGRAQVNLLTGTGLVFYPLSGSNRGTDTNSFARLSASYPVSLRLMLTGDVSATYGVEPDLSSDAGLDRRAGNFLNLDSNFSARYRWSLRLSNSASYGIRVVSYDDPGSEGAFLNRMEQTFGGDLSFRLSLRSTVSAEYRLTVTDADLALRDSTTQFLLGGFDYRVSVRTRAVIRAGVTLRSENAIDRIDPNFAGSLSYSLGPRGALAWNVGYSIEQGNTRQATTRMTARTGLSLSYLISYRLSANVGLNYHHDQSDGGAFSPFPGATGSTSTEDAYDVSLGLQYVLNRRFTIQGSYTHSEVISDQAFRSYARNRFSVGVNFSF
ncbi:MAG: outer membrane beta-barrel protein [Chthoniobacterales bacterium]